MQLYKKYEPHIYTKEYTNIRQLHNVQLFTQKNIIFYASLS